MGSAVLAAVLFVCGALTSPTKRSDGAFSVPIERKANPEMLSGPAVIAKAYSKYGKNISDVNASIDVRAETGSVQASPTIYDQEYLASIWVGGQLVKLDIDSGSSDLWVYSTELPATEQAGHSIYNPHKSRTAKALAGETWAVQYGDGSYASGNVYTDCVWAGGTVVEGQAVELAEYISGSFMRDVSSDGLMGLAFDVLNEVTPTKQRTFISNAIVQGLSSPVFTANLFRGSSGNSSYDFGYIDSRKYRGSIAWSPIDTLDGYWRFNATGFAFSDNATITFLQDSIVDTGTSIMFLDENIVTYYYELVPKAEYNAQFGGYTFPCSSADSLPDLTIQIADKYNVRVPGSYLAYAPLMNGSTSCFGGLQTNVGLPFQILGDVFLKATFAIFDRGTSPPRVGFADKA